MTESPEVKWFWAWIIEMTQQKSDVEDEDSKVEVWKNLVIVKASTAEEAILSAEEIGRFESGDCDGTLRLDGKPAVTEFVGLGGIGLIHEDFAHGAEIMWEMHRGNKKSVESLVKDRSSLLENLKAELNI